MYCDEKSPMILMLSETHLKDYSKTELLIESYKMISCDSDSVHTGAIESHNLTQIVKDFTRICIRKKKNGEEMISRTTIDHILTNSKDVSYEVNKTDCVTDHFMLNNIKLMRKKNEKKKKVYKNNWKNYSKENLCDLLDKVNYIDDDNESFDAKASYVIKNIQSTMNKIVKRRKVFRTKNKWFSDKIKLLKKVKENARTKYELSNDENDRLDLLRKVKEYKEKIKEEKCSEVQKNIRENKNDPKKLWRILKSLYKEESKEIESVMFDGVHLNDSSEIAENMNNAIREMKLDLLREELSSMTDLFMIQHHHHHHQLMSKI
ncbi:CLUMA_CG001514, isoform A [Clunio marinus]|uniref:CLUMA_CG001514, isoform A n=1 Tax=Clunio marinus TaxID=568069 RepID=A0A1J1HJY6_9DIPT|nr:CLUMA_CG001514, isoform A [Clunio marinus]